MPATDFGGYIEREAEGYARERARNLGTPVEQEREVAARQIRDLLPQGVHTPGHHLWHVARSEAEVVGTLWVYVDRERGSAFIYSIAIDEQHRGQGLGRRTLELLEEEAKALGVKRISLNVFADNPVARRLYESQGYTTTSVNMQKVLRSE
jgi:ribosomal protein S18 acetylase RimI-like enzyme